MPGLLAPKKRNDIQVIMGKLAGASTSENTSDELKKKNEDSMEAVSMADSDEVNADTAVEAASQSVMSAFTAQDNKALASALKDIFNLFELESDKSEPSEEV